MAISEGGFAFSNLLRSNLCKSCSMISIYVPKSYNDRPASHIIFTVFLNGELISKSVSSFKIDFENTEFVGIVSKEKGVSYEINIEYGSGRCMGYQFSCNSPRKGS